MSVRDVEWGQPLLERVAAPELQALARQSGRVSPATGYVSIVPWAYLAVARLNQRLLKRVYLDHDLADMVGLVVSQDNSCRYCFAVQRALLRGIGFSEERVSKLEESFLVAELSRAERAALDFSRRVSRSNPLVLSGDLASLREVGFSEDEIRELAVVAALNVFFNRTATILAMPPENWEALPERWYANLARPLFALYLKRGVRVRASAIALREDQKAGPFSYLTTALDGHPVAGELREILDAMWDSPHLSRRAKALCFAVVARALGCGRSEREASELARAEGLSAEHLTETLANLASQALDDVERQLVPFSRQTVWYQVPDLQRRSRELFAASSKERFVEAVIVTSLANLVCRLGFLAEAR